MGDGKQQFFLGLSELAFMPIKKQNCWPIVFRFKFSTAETRLWVLDQLIRQLTVMEPMKVGWELDQRGKILGPRVAWRLGESEFWIPVVSGREKHKKLSPALWQELGKEDSNPAVWLWVNHLQVGMRGVVGRRGSRPFCSQHFLGMCQLLSSRAGLV